jgi:endonuclease III
MTLREVVATLRKYYGSPAGPPTTDPFELILWETVVYLAPMERRREAFDELKRTLGTTPDAILAASRRDLEQVTSHGILKQHTAGKLREAASIALDRFGGDLASVVRGPLPDATRALRLFPGIGVPGAEKILLFSGRALFLAPESNGLRVLARVGLVREEASYARSYAASRELAPALSKDPAVVKEAHLLLQQHGQTLCTRTMPRCDECPLARGCAYARSTQMPTPGRLKRPKPRHPAAARARSARR